MATVEERLLELEARIQQAQNIAQHHAPEHFDEGNDPMSEQQVVQGHGHDEIRDNDGDTKWQAEESADEDILRADTGGTERLTIEIGGLFIANAHGVVVGHTAKIDFGATPEFQVLGTATPDSSMGFARFENNASGPDVRFLKSRAAAIGDNTIVQNGDTLGRFRFQGADGGDFNTTAAEVLCRVDAVPALNNIPGRLVFRTRINGGSLSDRIIVDNVGNLNLLTGTLFITEQADANADVGGRGQIWVNTATPNELFFTDDAGTDFSLSLRATTTISGPVELATATETTTGTDATRAVTPDGLAGSEYGERAVQLVVFDFATDVATGDGKYFFHIDSRLAGMDLVDVHAEVITAGTTNTTDIQIRNLDTGPQDMLSTKLTIDSGEKGSDTAATAAVIDGTKDDVAENDVIRIDVDAVSTTAPKGLVITLGWRLP